MFAGYPVFYLFIVNVNLHTKNPNVWPKAIALVLVVFVWLWLFDATNIAAVISRCLINDNLGLFLFIRMFLANMSFNFISSFAFSLILLQFQRIQ